MSDALPWWKTGVVYQIYPRSFADTTGNGVGDIPGITSRLDYLAWLGVDAIWLSPFFPSPMKDFGYDVSDYCGVHPLFGTMDDFDAMVAEAHARNIKVIIDWVPAHTSDQHPWFIEARSSRTSPKRDWYVWRDPGPNGEPPNNWTASFVNRSAWTLDEATGQMYLHSFLPEQPDLNWRNPEVVAAHHDVLLFWLDRGVDGFRADVVHNIGKAEDLPDIEKNIASIPHVGFNEDPHTHHCLRGIRKLLDAYGGDKMMVGETAIPSTKRVATYYGANDELHLAFNFLPLFAGWSAKNWQREISKAQALLLDKGHWPTWVLSNHDIPRHRTRFGGSDARARAAAMMLLTLPGTPFLYMGEELGLKDGVIPKDRVVDPGGRDGCRCPIPWTPAPGHGWPADPWLPFPPHPADTSVERQRAEEKSVLHLYRRVLAIRRQSPALHAGALELDTPYPHLVIYTRVLGDDARTIIINFGKDAEPLEREGATVELSSDGLENVPCPPTIPPDTAFILRDG